MNAFQHVMKTANHVVTPLLHAPVIGGRLSKSTMVISYTGRRSGKPVSTPVNYTRDGDSLTVGVAMPDRKTWWRNFYPDSAPITVTIGGTERKGTAVARRDDEHGVRVEITLDA